MKNIKLLSIDNWSCIVRFLIDCKEYKYEVLDALRRTQIKDLDLYKKTGKALEIAKKHGREV